MSTAAGYGLAAAMLATLAMTAACEPTSGPRDGCGPNCDKTKEAYIVVVIATGTERHPNHWVFVKDDAGGAYRNVVERLTPVTYTYRIDMTPDNKARNVHVLVSPMSEDGQRPLVVMGGKVTCTITKFGGAEDGALIDYVHDGRALREISCIKPAGR